MRHESEAVYITSSSDDELHDDAFSFPTENRAKKIIIIHCDALKNLEKLVLPVLLDFVSKVEHELIFSYEMSDVNNDELYVKGIVQHFKKAGLRCSDLLLNNAEDANQIINNKVRDKESALFFIDYNS